MKIYYFAWVRERIGLSEEATPLPKGVVTVGDLVRDLRTRSAGHLAALNDLSLLRVAVNQVHVKLDHRVTDSDEIAFFPPVTGG